MSKYKEIITKFTRSAENNCELWKFFRKLCCRNVSQSLPTIYHDKELVGRSWPLLEWLDPLTMAFDIIDDEQLALDYQNERVTVLDVDECRAEQYEMHVKNMLRFYEKGNNPFSNFLEQRCFDLT
uniref:Uncharacterized protein n=1 Tax=Globodera pallida TaxID=36090 RepID=A0A183BJS6_GLOPA